MQRYEDFKDTRGSIRDLLRDVKVDAVTVISTVAGAVRGNHWHHLTTQWTYVVSGRMRIVTERLPNGPVESHLGPGDMWIDEPDTRHAWQALEDTVVLVFTQGPRSGENYESDTYRLPEESQLIPRWLLWPTNASLV